MQKVLTAAQMREVDRLTTERYGIPSIILMENAAHAVARVITEKLGGSVKGKSILILCGKGNNGGDGAALARILWTQGADCFVHLFGNVSETKGDAMTNFDSLRRIDESRVTNGPNENCLVLYENSEFDSSDFIRDTDVVIVDALFGTGLSRQIEGELGNLLRKFPKWKTRLDSIFVAIDIPSGVSSDLEFAAEVAFPADVTVSFTAPKPANVLTPTFRKGGELVVANIGSPRELIDAQPSQLFVAEVSDAAKWMADSRYSDDSYKNKRGHALIIAGSETYSGAAVLSGNSAIRSGVGLVALACLAEAKTEIASRILPEVILATIGSKEFDELAPKANAIAVGPGLSATDPDIESLVRKIVEERTRPVIVDAGALWFFNPPNGIPGRHADEGVRLPLILTPHEGEFMRLLGTDDKDAIKDRVTAVREFSQANNVILVLKGERVLIGHPDGRVVVNPTGNSGLGKAGNGDTLTGVLAGFCAQAAAMDIDIFETVVAAVYIAGLAGDIAEKKYGKRVMTASDVRECLSEAFSTIEGGD
ncbi:MAG: NAD(P)H-hydrate dehydratase [bacterium]|nr:NAD(P)H-hydrate dehydratase [bacterium]